MENLKHYTMKAEVERTLETSGLPTYAKYLIAKEVMMIFEKKYLDDVKAEYDNAQKEHGKKAEASLDNVPAPEPTPES